MRRISPTKVCLAKIGNFLTPDILAASSLKQHYEPEQINGNKTNKCIIISVYFKVNGMVNILCLLF